MLERFIEKMLVHVYEVFPEETKDRDKQEIRDLIEEGIKRASDYEITEEPQVALFIDLMVGLGAGFEKKKPCMFRQPRSCSSCSCSFVSTPSAMMSIPNAWLNTSIDLTSARLFPFSSSITKRLSILIAFIGNFARKLREE